MALLALIVADMKCSCLSVFLVYATRHTANCVVLAILIGTYQLANDILRFDFYTDLLSVVISRTILTYIKCQNQNENAAKTVTKTRIEGNVDLWDRDHRLCNTA